MKDVLIFGGVKSTDFGIYVLGVNDEDTPTRDYEVVEVYGRSGDLHFDKGRYTNIERIYNCVAMKKAGVKIEDYFSTIMQIIGYARIEDTFHPEYYKMGVLSGDIKPQFGTYKQAGKFDLVFNCKPQKWLKQGENQITLAASNTVYNPTLYDAHPIFELTGNGTIVIGSNTITVANNSGTIILDAELGDAYDKTTHDNKNSCVTVTNNDFPTLKPGLNNITKSNFTTAKMTPRWWTL